MKIFRRTSLPKSIKYNGVKFIKGVRMEGAIIVEVLAGRLRGKEDLHGKTYKPSIFYFNREKN